MKFRDLLMVEYDRNSNVISEREIALALPNTPREVILQFYADHGRNGQFQKQYRDLEISSICWEKKAFPAHDLVESSCYKPFLPWLNDVARRALEFPNKGWDCIDARQEVIEHWREHGTWRLSPIFLAGGLLEIIQKLHLVEGHTRVGILLGLVTAGIIKPETKHEIWLGTICT